MSEKLLLLMLHTLLDDNGQVVFQFIGRDDLLIDVSDGTFAIGDEFVERGDAFQYLSDNYDVLVDIC